MRKQKQRVLSIFKKRAALISVVLFFSFKQHKNLRKFSIERYATPPQPIFGPIDPFMAIWSGRSLYFVYGLHFEVETDHKPLVALSKKTGEVPNNRMQVMLLSTAEYNITVNYLPGI